MVSGFLTDLAKAALGEAAFGAVVVLAIGGTAGRVVIGALSDRYGRPLTLTVTLAAQAALMLVASLVAPAAHPNAAVALTLIGLIAFNYGGNLSLFPAFTRDRFGLSQLRPELRRDLHGLGRGRVRDEPDRRGAPRLDPELLPRLFPGVRDAPGRLRPLAAPAGAAAGGVAAAATETAGAAGRLRSAVSSVVGTSWEMSWKGPLRALSLRTAN